MSYYLRVFCSSASSVSRRDFVEFITEGVYFDSPRFEPPANSPTLDDVMWKQFAVWYEPEKRPLLFYRHGDDEVLREEAREAADAMKEPSTASKKVVVGKLATCKQLFVIEVNPGGITEECWAMVDCLEAFLARRPDGIIYAPDEGFYNADLKLICKL